MHDYTLSMHSLIPTFSKVHNGVLRKIASFPGLPCLCGEERSSAPVYYCECKRVGLPTSLVITLVHINKVSLFIKYLFLPKSLGVPSPLTKLNVNKSRGLQRGFPCAGKNSWSG